MAVACNGERSRWIRVALMAATLAGCGGGGSSQDPPSPSPPSPSPPPPPAGFTVGGSVDSLAAGSLRLSDGVETISVAAGATRFAFTTQRTSGTPYKVSIVGQPLGFTQACELAHAEGAVNGADVTDLDVTCHTASVAVSLLAGRGIAANGPVQFAVFNKPIGATADAAGNLYIADAENNRIRKISPDGIVTTVAGGGNYGADDGPAETASFYHPSAVATDAAGNLYVADTYNQRIRKISAAGLVTTLAGRGDIGRDDGPGTEATFDEPRGLAVDSSGNVYVADTINCLIRKISPAGVVTTLSGSGELGFSDGAGTAASFHYPIGLAIDPSGTLYVGDSFNHLIRRVDKVGGVTTWAGSVSAVGATDGLGSAASFNSPEAVSLDSAGNVYVADAGNSLIRKISPIGMVTTFAGKEGTVGHVDGVGPDAAFYNPRGIAVDAAGTVFVVESEDGRVRRITPSASVSTWGGGPSYGHADGPGDDASFFYPNGIAPAADGTLYVTDRSNNSIRKISPDGVVSTLAGSYLGSGHHDATGSLARFDYPIGIAVDAANNVYVADTDNHAIRKITPAGVVTTLAGTPHVAGLVDGPAASARFDRPIAVAVDASGNLLVADWVNNVIRKISADGMVSTLAGSLACGHEDGVGSAARFCGPQGIALDTAGNVYVADTENVLIRKISPQGTVTTLAGLGPALQVCQLVDGLGAVARFCHPRGISVDLEGNVYVSDVGLIRMISPGGRVTTIAGNYPGDANGNGFAASFREPQSIAADAAGNLFVADSLNQQIRKISPK